MTEVREKLAPGTPIEVWFQDEMRVGQKNKLTYRWARKGSRPRAGPADAQARVAAGFSMCTTTSDLALLRAGAHADLRAVRPGA